MKVRLVCDSLIEDGELEFTKEVSDSSDCIDAVGDIISKYEDKYHQTIDSCGCDWFMEFDFPDQDTEMFKRISSKLIKELEEAISKFI